jgi:hypothetical protein
VQQIRRNRIFRRVSHYTVSEYTKTMTGFGSRWYVGCISMGLILIAYYRCVIQTSRYEFQVTTEKDSLSL